MLRAGGASSFSCFGQSITSEKRHKWKPSFVGRSVLEAVCSAAGGPERTAVLGLA